MWGDSGIAITTQGLSAPLIVSDHKQGVIICWDNKTFQRYNGVGTALWGDSGIATTGMITHIVEDNVGGAYLAGMQYLGYNGGDPYWRAIGQQIDSNGTLRFGTSGIVLEDSLHNIGLNPNKIVVQTSRPGRGVYAWSNRVSDTLRTYTRSISDSEGVQSADDIVAISKAGRPRSEPVAIVPSDKSFDIFLLSDVLSPTGGPTYGRRFSHDDGYAWGDTGIVLTRLSLQYVKAVSDRRGGIIVVGFNPDDFSIRMQQCSRNGVLGEILTSAKEDRLTIPQNVVLFQNYPNPCNPTTEFSYEISEQAHVNLTVFGILGDRIATLVDSDQPPGVYHLSFDVSTCPSGVYFYRLVANNFIETKHFTVLK